MGDSTERTRQLKEENKLLQLQIEALLDEERDRGAHKRVPQSIRRRAQDAQAGLKTVEHEKQRLTDHVLPRLASELESAQAEARTLELEASELQASVEQATSRAAGLRSTLMQTQSALSATRPDPTYHHSALLKDKASLLSDIANLQEELRFVSGMADDRDRARAKQKLEARRSSGAAGAAGQLGAERATVPMHQYLSLVHHTQALHDRLVERMKVP
eukprot:TRINITY_DN73482_c0_g1_i1.p1 TRINITY_DN73482_c0_g1~~TRINITY_DN73482_c0_g1_i1.p1  ORF type:complete len:217 (+),score=56.32 TRINITY_DN73482_c0_g1_i1:46-696(+)